MIINRYNLEKCAHATKSSLFQSMLVGTYSVLGGSRPARLQPDRETAQRGGWPTELEMLVVERVIDVINLKLDG